MSAEEDLKMQNSLTMKIYKTDKEMIFEVPADSPRYDPYSEKGWGSHRALSGLIFTDEFGNKEYGWSNVIDMAYKDKPDQCTDRLIKWWGSKEEFISICEKIGVRVTKLSLPPLPNVFSGKSTIKQSVSHSYPFVD